jgi:hypothetical protein
MATIHEKAGVEAHHIMVTADKMATDGRLSMIELCTFLKHTEHEGFLEFLLADKYHAGGKWDYHEQFRKANANHDEHLDLAELTAAVETWMAQGSPGLSVPHKVEPKKAEMNEQERELVNFRVPGIPPVVLPPPPQKKRSIYEKPYARKPSAETMHTKTGFSLRAFDEKQKVGLRSSTGPAGLLLSSDDVAKSATGSAFPAILGSSSVLSLPRALYRSRPPSFPCLFSLATAAPPLRSAWLTS